MLKLVNEWDKVFPKDETINHQKVTFKNHFGIELAADMYWPKAGNKFPAIAVKVALLEQLKNNQAVCTLKRWQKEDS